MNALYNNNAFDNLYWYRLPVELVNIRTITAAKSHPLSIFQAIVKDVTTRTFPEKKEGQNPTVFFHIQGRNHSFKVREAMRIPLEVFFTRSDERDVKKWIHACTEYLQNDTFGKNYRAASMGEPELRTYSALVEETSGLKTGGEIALHFYTPLHFNPRKKNNRTYLDKEQFTGLFEKRFTQLFGRKIKYNAGDDDFSVFPYYWKYTQIKHPSRSQPGHTQYINGCFGNLYIKGSFRNILPFLLLGSELHTGAKLSNGQGYYKLLLDPPGYFNAFFPHRKTLIAVIKEVIEKHDEPAESPESAERLLYREDQYAGQLYREISEDRYQPSPNTAFRIKKKDGSERVVEQVGTKDYIIQQYLLHTIHKPFDRFFEEGSIGYRKGISREKAVRMVREAIDKGYNFVIESDIEDFFPSVDLEHVSRLLDHYIPEKDGLIKSLLRKCLYTDYVLNGKLCIREKGLAQGSPLSPVLANLYLDAFDETAASWGVRMIRYADDFIILTKTKEDAEHILSQTEAYLSEIGLKIKKEKTGIRPVAGGFHFLGIQFEKSAAKVEPEEAIRRLRKPLYITDRFLFLALNGEAIDIYKNRKLIETIPLRRISEIIVMERVSFSSALLRQCVERNIPFTITLDSGYFITTVKPDSKKYYEMSSSHAMKYYSLSDTERLAIAKEIVATKLKNYIPLYRQRYIPGTNERIKELQHYSDKIYRASALDEVRGFEGIAARNHYRWINSYIDEPKFHIVKRNRKKPDRINSLLNYGYYLLFSRLNATMRAVGLNPYLGFLHSPEDSWESLVSDFVEIFRARIDRFIIKIINLKIVKPEDFVTTSRGLYLEWEVRKKFLKQFEAGLEHTTGRNNLSFKEQIYLQIVIFRNWVRDEGSLTFMQWEDDNERDR